MTATIKEFLADSQLLLNAVGEGVYGFDKNGHAVFVNPASEQMTGWKAEELLGKNIHQYHHHSHANGDNYPCEECNIYNTMRDGVERKISHEVFWRKDGTSFPVEYTSTPVFKAGELIGAVAVFRDVSEQRLAESKLRSALKQVQALTEKLQAENSYLQSEINENWHGSGLEGNSPTFQAMLQQIKLVAHTNSTVLILGENGTGKELVARNLHQLSQRKNRPLVKVNCAAFSANLLESELFGHEKGAFTGATDKRQGRFELADKGTLFLDEIGELSPDAQSKLLRVLQEQEFERVGGSKTIKVDIRIIAATNQDLQKMVEQGKFRMDLFYRLNVFPIVMPALRDRIEDIPLLCHSILAQLNQKLNKNIIGISKRSLNKLAQYHWPGNIRELQNILEREVILSTSNTLQIQQKFEKSPLANNTQNKPLNEIEKAHIIDVLNDCFWRIGGDDGAAKVLGLPDSTLRSRMKKLQIHRR
ncbi:sigma-54 interaction domain-containing protein [Psychromonas sp. Urea-02u-13]|uniref:sigma-54 interaction domain-containing protein n=1 Tax=Psychromonas sp. Urea-02u-13 TaxID=2058326 RepID=UPI000C34A8AB|nr:sigma 54-interacting transcriptional regulator [Psychromonas sp. Urea-02u-13]PKG37850.1 Fis family transcriptional regulator [Psychromonas sp. Urea-02u-13]